MAAQRAAGAPRGLTPDTPVQYVRGVGPAIATRLGARQISTVRDLLYFVPRQYGRRGGLVAIRDLVPGCDVKVRGVITACRTARGRRGRPWVELALSDGTGLLVARWFNVRARAFESFGAGQELQLAGRVEHYAGQLQMIHPELTRLDQPPPGVPAPGRASLPLDEQPELVAGYLQIEGVPPRRLRQIVVAALPAAAQLDEPLPAELLAAHRLPPLGESLLQLHRPPVDAALDDLNACRTPWHRRLIYGELLALQVGIALRRDAQVADPARPVPLASGELAARAAALFPFALTAGQAAVVRRIEAELRRDRPMNLLIQGDVGSGKTAVALTAAAGVMEHGLQAALMAPTELLAQQHYEKARQLFGAAGGVALLLGAQRSSERQRVLADIAVGRARLVIGTHALIQEGVRFKELVLAIVDEQHRFGVLQRARLIGKGALGPLRPHALVMTATPIPRTLAMTIYGDLDVAVIDGLPPGRKPIVTRVVRERERPQLLAHLRAQLQQGHQAYMVFPLVEESESELLAGIRDATSMAEQLQREAFAGLGVGLLHGRMSGEDKAAVMERFKAGALRVLVATTVIEVGIDVPSATMIVIEHAERFGLSQLHQLRGRVGRGTAGGACFLVIGHASDEAYRRLTTLERHADGFAVAEADLAIRGPGDMIGTRQHGLPDLIYGDLRRDGRILAAAHADARRLLDLDPTLGRWPHLRQLVEQQWAGRLALAKVG